MTVSPSPEPRARPAGIGSGGRRRLPLLLEPLLALGLLSAAVLPFLHLWYRSRVALLEAEAGARMDQGISALQTIFVEVAGDSQLMSRLPLIRQAARTPTPASLALVPPVFGAFLQSYDRYLAIELLDGRGRTLAEAVRDSRPYALGGGEHLRDHPLLLRTALAQAPDAITISDPRWYQDPRTGFRPMTVMHVLRTLPRNWPGRLLRLDMRLDALLHDLKAQVFLPRTDQEVVVLDARGYRLDQGGRNRSFAPPWSRPAGTVQRAETAEGLVLWRSFDPLGRAQGSRERWTLAQRIPSERLQQLGLLHQPVGLALVLTLYGGMAASVTLLALARRRRRRERAEFAAVLDSLHDPHVLLRPIRNPIGRIIDFQVAQLNQAAHRYNGPQPGLPGSRTLLEWMPHHQPSGLLSAYANAMELGEGVVLDDVPLQHPVHGARRFEIRAVRVDQMLCVSWRDVTERRQLIERLAESEKQFRLLAENASDVVLRVSGSRLVQWVSPALTAMLGWAPQEWIGRPVEELLLPSLPVEAAPREAGPAPVGIERRRVADAIGQLH
ncbi:MAG: PAS domain S-box protein [Synechococcus sp.]